MNKEMIDKAIKAQLPYKELLEISISIQGREKRIEGEFL